MNLWSDQTQLHIFRPARLDSPPSRACHQILLHIRRMQRTPKEIRRRGEAFPFRQHLLQLRHEMGWSQLQLALVLGISARTLSHWQMAHWLPPHKQRVHILLKLHDAPPERVLAIADALGVSRDPIVERFLQPYVDAMRARP